MSRAPSQPLPPRRLSWRHAAVVLLLLLAGHEALQLGALMSGLEGPACLFAGLTVGAPALVLLFEPTRNRRLLYGVSLGVTLLFALLASALAVASVVRDSGQLFAFLIRLDLEIALLRLSLAFCLLVAFARTGRADPSLTRSR